MHGTADLPRVWTGRDLLFNADLHEYRLPLDGRVVPNVTTILRATGMSTDFAALAGISATLGDRIDFRRALGTAAHADCHALDDGDLDVATVHPDVWPYVQAWASFKTNTGLVPMARERRVFHPALFYCGTLDGIFLLPNGRRVLGDIKIGDPDDAAADLQTAAYEAAYMAEHPDEIIDERWSIRLCPDKGVPYRITNYSTRANSWEHFRLFSACVSVYAEQQARRKGAR